MPVSVSSALKDVTRLGIGTAPIIYYVEAHPKYGPVCREVFTQARQQRILIYASTLAYTEVLVKPLRVADETLVIAYQRLLSSRRPLSTLQVSRQVAETAADLRARYNLKTPDALQVANAVVHNCDAFLTNDADLKCVAEIPVLIVSELTI